MQLLALKIVKFNLFEQNHDYMQQLTISPVSNGGLYGEV